MNGESPIIVKRLTFKVCGKIAKRKIFARVSTASGKRYDNSLTQTISWQHGATSTYSFSGLNFPFTEGADGSNIRVWLVSGGPFYFNRDTAGPGHMIADGGHTFPGSPIGSIKYAEVASAPSGLTVSRDEQTATTLHLSWTRETDDGGAGRMGYRVQVAQDDKFTVGLRNIYVSTEKTVQYGFTRKSAWFVRVTTRNEVSEHYKLPGGVWSTVASVPSVPIDSGGTPSPPDDTGLPSGSTGNPGPPDTGAPQHLTYLDTATPSTSADVTVTPASTAAVMQSMVRLPATGEFYLSQVHPESNGWESTRLSRIKADGTLIDQMLLTWGGHGTRIEVTRESGVTYIWTTYQRDAAGAIVDDWVKFPYKAGTFSRSQIPGLRVITPGAGVYRLVAFDLLNSYAVLRVGTSGKETYSRHRLTAAQAGDFSAPLNTITLDQSTNFGVDGKPTLQGFATFKGSLLRYTGAPSDVVGGDPPQLVEYAWSDGTAVKTLDLSTMDKTGGSYPGGRGEPESASIYNPDGTSPELYLGVATGPVGGPHGYDFFTLSLTSNGTSLNDGSGNGNGNGNGDGTGDSTVYAPLPDVSSLETIKGGLLLSHGTAKNQEHTAYLMERGGTARIGQFIAATQITWDRRRDDISEARVELDVASVEKNRDVLKRIAVGRHELKIFRGQEAVWEGPITLVSRSRTLITVSAKDVMWYANRTVMHQGYSNAYPNMTFAVDRVAGILVAELGRKEALDPPINVLPYIHTYIEDGDAQTTRTTLPFSAMAWEHIDDMAAKSGIDYTVVGRAIHIWDTSRAALGRTRTLTENDFIGDATITEYGVELATHYWVTDGNGHAGVHGAIDDFYGEVELLATAYGESGNSVNDPNSPDNNQTIPQDQLDSQAQRGYKGRNPIPTGLHIQDDSQLDVSRGGLGFDVLVPGVYVPIRAALAGKTVSQVQKLQTIKVQATSAGEQITVSLYPASDDDLLDEGLSADQVDASAG